MNIGLHPKPARLPIALLMATVAYALLACSTLPEPGTSEGQPSPYAAGDSLAAPQPLAAVEDLFQEKKYEAAARALDRFRAQNRSEEIWQRYYLGQAQIELGARELGLKTLEKNYALLQKNAEELSSDERRVAARSLKKIGQYYRQKKDLAKAYTFHHLQYLYLQRWGSAAELHDVLLSLDVDSYELGNFFASEHWLRESLKVAEAIQDPLLRSRALAMSSNNLADTLRLERRWPEAVEMIEASRGHWRSYDQQKASEHRELWSILQAADIYRAWAEALRKEPEEARDKGQLARQQAEEALILAENLSLNAADRAELEARVEVFGLRPDPPANKKQRAQRLEAPR